MTITEKIAYIQGLAEGLGVNDSTKEGKVIIAMLDVLKDIGLTVEETDEELDDIADIMSDMEESISDLEDEVYGDYDEDDDELDLEDLYEVTCPSCNNTITIDYEILDKSKIACPNCGEDLEFDLDFLDDEDCDCCHGHDQ